MTDDQSHRVLLATIRDMGNCPCPRCFVKKGDIWKMGMVVDMKSRIKDIQVDDEHRRRKVSKARQYIYRSDSRITVGSAGIERMLKPKSWVPTQVIASANLHLPSFLILYPFVERILGKDPPCRSLLQLPPHACPRPSP